MASRCFCLASTRLSSGTETLPLALLLWRAHPRSLWSADIVPRCRESRTTSFYRLVLQLPSCVFFCRTAPFLRSFLRLVLSSWPLASEPCFQLPLASSSSCCLNLLLAPCFGTLLPGPSCFFFFFFLLS